MEKGVHMAIYSRKSRFTGRGESVENQVSLCRQYIALHYGETEAATALVYEDEGFSGGDLERPRFRRMMRDAAAGRIQAVVVYRLDRISRNIGDFATLIEELAKKKVAFISIREQFDTSSPMGRAMMYIASVFSQLERETIAERIRDNMQELAKTGRWLGGVTPFGFQSECVEAIREEKRVCHYRLSGVKEELETVRQIFALFLAHASLTETVKQLEIAGVRTRRGQRFTRDGVRAILCNPVYLSADPAAYRWLTAQGCRMAAEEEAFDGACGVMVYNRTVQRKGQAHQIRPCGEWIVAAGEHPGVIDGEWWSAVQRIFASRRTGERKGRSHQALLSGVIFCAQCGGRMRVKLRAGEVEGERRFVYLCTTREQSQGAACHAPPVNGNELDRAVLVHILSRPVDRRIWERGLERLEREARKNSGEESLASAFENEWTSQQNAMGYMRVEEKRALCRADVERVCVLEDQAEVYWK